MLFSILLLYTTLLCSIPVEATAETFTPCSSSDLHRAVRGGDYKMLKDVIRRTKDLYVKDCYGMTAMELALALGNEGAAYTLLQGSYDVNAADEQGERIILNAIRKGSMHEVEELVEFGGSVDYLNSKGLTPFLEALLSGREYLVALFIKAGAKMDVELKGGDGYLHKVVELGEFKSALKLLKFKVPLDPVNIKDETPLTKAVLKDNPAFVNLLVSRGADVQRTNKLGETYLHLAVKQNSTKVLPALLREGISVDAQNKVGETPLLYAVKQNNAEVARALLESGADSNKPNRKGETSLHLTVMHNSTEVFNLLLRNGTNVDAENSAGETPLFYAARENNAEVARDLIESCADLSKSSRKGETSLHLAAMHNSTEVINLLLRNGTNVDAENEQLETPLFYAVKQNNAEVAKALIESGADSNKSNKKGETSLHLAAMHNSTEVINLLLRNGTNVDAENEQLETPLFYAAKQNNAEVARTLIDSGADLNRLNQVGQTYLHMAGKNNTLLERFLELGINPDLRDSTNRSVICLAVNNDDTRTMDLLYEYGSDVNQTCQLHGYRYSGVRTYTGSLLYLATKLHRTEARDWLLAHGAIDKSS